jgi:hypothetical protein
MTPLYELMLNVVAVGAPTLLFAALLVAAIEFHHRHDPHTHSEAPAMQLVVNVATPPPPSYVPFIQGNTMDVANDLVTRPRRPAYESYYVTEPPLVLRKSAGLDWLPTYPSQPGRG